MKTKIMITFAAIFVCILSGCGKTDTLSQYSTDGMGYLTYTDIDTVCDTPQLVEAGANLLVSMKEQLLLSFVVDSSIEITEELGNYDHLILTNSQWVERFGDLNKLEPVEYSSLSNSMQEFLNAQMPIWTVDGSVLSDEVSLYQYREGGLFAFPVNVTLSAAEPLAAKNPLIILVDEPAQILKADSCMLPLTSSGNVLFANAEQLKQVFEDSELRDYGAVQEFEGSVK